jgi:speckle-type POZ protein
MQQQLDAVEPTLNIMNVKETNSLNIVRQWVSRVINYSSQYNEDTWSANKIIGPPLVYPNYGDLQNSWAQTADFHANHFIELEFPEEVYVTKINIYETYHAGGVVRIKLKDPLTDNWKIVWDSAVGPISIESSRIFSPDLKKTLFKTKYVRLDVDCTAANSFCEIDAVELIGKKFQVNIYKFI